MTKKKVHVMEPDEKLRISTSTHHIFMPMHTYIHKTHTHTHTQKDVKEKSENKDVKEEDLLHLI